MIMILQKNHWGTCPFIPLLSSQCKLKLSFKVKLHHKSLVFFLQDIKDKSTVCTWYTDHIQTPAYILSQVDQEMQRTKAVKELLYLSDNQDA